MQSRTKQPVNLAPQDIGISRIKRSGNGRGADDGQ